MTLNDRVPVLKKLAGIPYLCNGTFDLQDARRMVPTICGNPSSETEAIAKQIQQCVGEINGKIFLRVGLAIMM